MASTTTTSTNSSSSLDPVTTTPGSNVMFDSNSTLSTIAGPFDRGTTLSAGPSGNGQDWYILMFAVGGIVLPLLIFYISMKFYLCRRDGCYNGCYGLKEEEDVENLTGINKINYLHNRAFQGSFYHKPDPIIPRKGKRGKRLKQKRIRSADSAKSLSTDPEGNDESGGLGHLMRKKAKGLKQKLKSVKKFFRGEDGTVKPVPMIKVETNRPLPPIPPMDSYEA